MPGPPRPSYTSAPSEPSIRRLGVRSSSSIDRPIRAQVVLAILGALVLLAVPLYLLRRPPASPDKEQQAQKSEVPDGFQPSVPAFQHKDEKDGRLSLGDPVRVRCASSPAARGQRGRLCDQLKPIEESLAGAIEETLDCAPTTGEGGSVNYVLKVDFRKKTLHVFPGASGEWKGPQARRASKCVKQALPAPEWEKLDPKFRYYEIAILATYRPPAPTATPTFE